MLVAFSSSTQVYATPTRNRQDILAAMSHLTPQSGTALGAGLAAAVKFAVGSLDRDGVHRKPGQYLPAVIVLASDGAQDRGALSPLQAADQAKAAGIRVDGIALGTPQGTVAYGYGRYQESIAVPPDPKTVELIAQALDRRRVVRRYEQRSPLDRAYDRLGSSIGR